MSFNLIQEEKIMFIAMLLGIIVGFIICIPVGPINVWVVNTYINHNFRSAMAIALGGSVMDFVYFMVILTGLSLFHFSDHTILILKIVGIILLFSFGVKELLFSKQRFALDEGEEKKTPKGASFFLLGVLLYISNPTLVATLSAIGAIIKSWNLFNHNTLNFVLLSIGIGIGTSLWFLVLIKIIERFENKIPEKFLEYFSKTCGGLILILSIYMGVRLYQTLS